MFTKGSAFNLEPVAKLPKFLRFGGGSLPYHWAFGWETGRDNALLCVKPNIKTQIGEQIALSPVCSNRLLAFCAFNFAFKLSDATLTTFLT